jgi:hypothetical protein
MPNFASIPHSSWQPTNDLDPDDNVNLLRDSQFSLSNSCTYHSDDSATDALLNFSPDSISFLHANVRYVVLQVAPVKTN